MFFKIMVVFNAVLYCMGKMLSSDIYLIDCPNSDLIAWGITKEDAIKDLEKVVLQIINKKEWNLKPSLKTGRIFKTQNWFTDIKDFPDKYIPRIIKLNKVTIQVYDVCKEIKQK